MFARFDEATHTFLSMHSISPDGTGEREVPMPGPEAGGTWANGSQLYAVLTELPDHRIGTVIIAPSGKIVRALAPPPAGLNLVCTVWSPDDQRLACEGWDESDDSRTGLYTVRASDGRDVHRLTRPPHGYNDFLGDYDPDGSAFVFVRTIDEDPGTLLAVSPRGGRPHAVTRTKVDPAAKFSPDGSMIATSASGALLVLSSDGRLVHRITEAGASLFGPDWSPDGNWLAYSRGVSGPFADIYISRPDGSDRFQVTDTPDNEITISWGPPAPA
jgi:Tol biopolymer transport system component